MNARQGHSISLLSALLLIYTKENTGSNRTDGRSYEQVGQSGILVTKFRKGVGRYFQPIFGAKKGAFEKLGEATITPFAPYFCRS